MITQSTISSDIDTLESIYGGIGCKRPGGYTNLEFELGLEKFTRFLEPYKIKSTMFMVGKDFEYKKNHKIIKDISNQGHEIGNHTYSHSQGFRFLSSFQMEEEIKKMEDLCKNLTNIKPIGFRSPGWNNGDKAYKILRKRKYLYDASIHPTFFMPILKILHFFSTSSRKRYDRTTMGQFNYMFAPLNPYKCLKDNFGRKGNDKFIEFPMTVTPIIRLPFFATFLLSTNVKLFDLSLKSILKSGNIIQFMFHLSDFVDYSHKELQNQVPNTKDRVYVPKALTFPLNKKIELFKYAIDKIALYSSFDTLKNISIKKVMA